MKTAKPLMEEISVEDYKAMKCKRKAPGDVGRGNMNKLEAKFAEWLEDSKKTQGMGAARRFWFESITLKLGHDLRYTPDFLVETMYGNLFFYEVKGFRRDDAMVKLRAAATRFPFFIFTLAEWKGGEWKFKTIPSV